MVTTCTRCVTHQKFSILLTQCVYTSCDCHNAQTLCPYTALTDLASHCITKVFSVRYELKLYTSFRSETLRRSCQGSGGQSPASQRGYPGSIPGQSLQNLWWTKWHWDRFFSGYFSLSLSVSLHQCSVINHNI
jgi:hypothetical protein